MNEEAHPDSPTILLYSLRKSELRAFRNKVMRIKSILSRYKGRFVGIAKSVLHLNPEGPDLADQHFGMLFFESLNDCRMFMNSERGFASMDYIDCQSSWIIPLIEPLEFDSVPTVLTMTIIPSQEVLDCLPPKEDDMGMGNCGARPNIGLTSLVERVVGNRQPFAMRVTQWRDLNCCQQWMQIEESAQVRKHFLGMAKTYLLALAMDYTDD